MAHKKRGNKENLSGQEKLDEEDNSKKASRI